MKHCSLRGNWRTGKLQRDGTYNDTGGRWTTDMSTGLPLVTRTSDSENPFIGTSFMVETIKILKKLVECVVINSESEVHYIMHEDRDGIAAILNNLRLAFPKITVFNELSKNTQRSS